MALRRMLVVTALVASIVLAPTVGWGQPGTGATGPVEIALLPEARADGPVVRIGNLAQLAGGDVKVREALARLDLAEFQGARDRVVLSRDEVKFRLLVAGVDARSFRLVGAPQCQVRKTTKALS